MNDEQLKTLKEYALKHPESNAQDLILSIEHMGYTEPAVRAILKDVVNALLRRSYRQDYDTARYNLIRKSPLEARGVGKHYHNGVKSIRVKEGHKVPAGYVPGMIRKTAKKWKKDSEILGQI